MSVTAEELTGLSEQEQAALADDAGDDAPETAEATEAEPEPAGAEPSAAEASDADEVSADDAPASTEPDGKNDQAEPFVPLYRAKPVADFDGQISALESQKKDLRTKYQDGDLDLDEYEDQREKIEDQARALREENFKATFAKEQEEQFKEQKWQWEGRRFLDNNPQFEQNEAIFNALNANVIALQNKAIREGKDQYDPEIIIEAKRQLEEALALVGGAKPADPASRPPASKAKPEVPPNLGDLPAADVAETGGDEFAHLDKLDGMALEAELAKLSKADQDRYLRGG